MLNSDLARSLYGQSARVIFQAAFFFVLAKLLPLEEFGFFSLVIAISALMLPFSGWGTQLLLVKESSIDKTGSMERLAASIRLTVLSGLVLSVFASCISTYIYFDGQFTFVFFLFATEVVLFRVYESYVSSYQGLGEFDKIITIRFYAPLTKLVSVILIYTYSDFLIYENKHYWVYVYSIVSLLGLIIYSGIFFSLNRVSTNYFMKKYPFNYRDGLLMSSSLLVYGFFASSDQIMLGSIMSKEVVAVYALSAKVYFMAFLPFQALSSVTIRRFFMYNGDQVRCGVELRRILKVCIPLSILLASLVAISSSLIPLALGEKYEGSKVVLISLMVIFPIKVCSAMLSDYLVGVGLQKRRLNIELFCCLINIVMNFILINNYGVLGAVAATMLSETALLTLFYCTYYQSNRIPI